MSIAEDYTWHFTVASYDGDSERRLKLSSQLRLQQEVGELHLNDAGLGYAELYNDGLVFVLTRAASVIYRPPIIEEKVKLTTWSIGTKGIQFYRCYRFATERDEILIDSMTAFAIIDPETHKLVRPAVFENYNPKYLPDRRNGCEIPGRIKMPGAISPAGTREIRYSDLDYNGHVNNAVYADFLCDFMPGGMDNKQIKSFNIGFTNEALLGDKVEMLTASEGNTAYFIGSHSRGACFESMCKF